MGAPEAVRCWKPRTSGDAPAELTAAATLPPADRAAPLVEVASAYRRFSTAAPPALDQVSIRVAAGEAVGVVGESGSGKTTLARCLIGLERLDSGTIRWSGTEAGARRTQIPRL